MRKTTSFDTGIACAGGLPRHLLHPCPSRTDSSAKTGPILTAHCRSHKLKSPDSYLFKCSSNHATACKNAASFAYVAFRSLRSPRTEKPCSTPAYKLRTQSAQDFRQSEHQKKEDSLDLIRQFQLPENILSLMPLLIWEDTICFSGGDGKWTGHVLELGFVDERWVRGVACVDLAEVGA